jgi:hypothetical protein
LKHISDQDAPDQQHMQCDLCIVGSGPAGITLATEMAKSGLHIVVIESGQTAVNNNIQALNNIQSTGKTFRPNFINRLRMLGGTSNLWPGRCMPLEPIDFSSRSWITHSGWPISYEEYAQYLPKAAKILGIADSQADAKNLAMPSVAIPIDLNTFSIKLAVWAKSPLRFAKKLNKRWASLSNISLVTGFTACAYSFNQNASRLEQIHCRSLSNKTLSISATRFVLCSGGIENARILLIAKQQNPHATFDTDNVGRFFMDHPRAVKGSIRLNKGVNWGEFLGHPVAGGIKQMGIGLSAQVQQQQQLLNSYICLEPRANVVVAKSYDTAVQTVKQLMSKGSTSKRLYFTSFDSIAGMAYQLTPKEILPNWLYCIYCWLRSFIKEHKRDLVIINQCEQLPNPDSRITLSDKKDTFGNPIASIHWQMSDAEIKSIQAIHQALGSWLKQQGIGELKTSVTDIQESDFDEASHHIGTTRMSNEPETGVVDSNLKLHGISNLYVCGSSVFATSGSGNPTWSIVAFALRLANHLGKS